jgi:hypothetical protein
MTGMAVVPGDARKNTSALVDIDKRGTCANMEGEQNIGICAMPQFSLSFSGILFIFIPITRWMSRTRAKWSLYEKIRRIWKVKAIFSKALERREKI